MSTTLDQDDTYRMTNLYPRHTGLPMTVWVSPRGRARHYARIKVCLVHGDRMVVDDTAVVAIAPEPRVVAGELSAADREQVFAWVRLNAEALRDFWEDGDAFRFLPRLRKL